MQGDVILVLGVSVLVLEIEICSFSSFTSDLYLEMILYCLAIACRSAAAPAAGERVAGNSALRGQRGRSYLAIQPSQKL